MYGYAPVRQVALPAGTTVDETPSIPLDLSGYQQCVIYITGTGTTSSGVVTIEEASYNPRRQTIPAAWSSITTVNASDVNNDATKATHLTGLQMPHFLRLRVSTAIGGGGSITAVVCAS